ncbi:MAG: TonB-dependent receptor [Ignavibacteriales bacterium]|nr:TonB-dependent receptor [Ignavibacteriales bacterium]
MPYPVRILYLICCFLLFTACLFPQNQRGTTISGKVVDEVSGRPMEFVNVVVRNAADSTVAAGTETDSKGTFVFQNIPEGEYFLRMSFVGYQENVTPTHRIGAQTSTWNLGVVPLKEGSVKLDEVLITAQKALFTNSIDRKVYNIGQDIMSKSGSTSELLQSIPSVEVDIDGNVSLRGSSSVLILINGKSSPLMAKSSATVLQQMPASSIERIELITNPSAKYKPDGTSGIINIVLKKNVSLGTNGAITANIGNNSRYNGNVRLNYNPGDLNLFGSYSLRQDSRNRITMDTRLQKDVSGGSTYYQEDLLSDATPLSHMAALGLDYALDASTSAGISGNYFYNGFTRLENASKVVQDLLGRNIQVFGRNRVDYEYEDEYGFKMFAEHKFKKKNQKLRLEINGSNAPEQEDNHYTDISTFPPAPDQHDNSLIKQTERKFETTLDYSDPLSEDATFETGYAGEMNRRDMDFYFENYSASLQRFLKDNSKSNRFIYDEAVHAFYATYERSFGDFGFMAGLRAEGSFIKSNLVTLDSTITNSYFSVFPTVHLTYALSPASELRLSYSKRVRRPEGDDLNPFPEYRDPRNISSGNPKLKPEYVHSLEFGCKFETDLFSVLPSLYYRYTYDRFTSITQLINDTTLLTTRTNLSNDRSTGIEVILSADLGDIASVHGSTNVFFNQIDASNLGYGQNKSVTTWSGALTVSVNVTRSSMMQVNSNYSSRRLTPQGESLPSYVVNMGMRQELIAGKLSITATVADVFKSLRRESFLDTPLLHQNLVNRRDSRIVYVGITYNFGAPPKKQKEESLRYDDSI